MFRVMGKLLSPQSALFNFTPTKDVVFTPLWLAEKVVYLMPLHRAFASYEFIADVRRFGGIKEILVVGTGATAGFPFGHCLGAIHYQKNYDGETRWSFTK